MQEVECSHCGVKWCFSAGRAEGFIWAHIRTHVYHCETRTEKEREQWLRATEKRVAKYPPKHTYYTFPNEAGPVPGVEGGAL